MLAWGVIIFRFVQFSGASVLFGASLFFLYTLPLSASSVDVNAVWRRPLLGSGVTAVLAATVLGLITQTAVLAGSLTEAIKPESLQVVLTSMSFGISGAVRILISGVTLGLLFVMRPGRSLWRVGALGGGAICVSMAWMGHGGATKGAAGYVHLIADVFHILAAAGWTGALACFSIMLVRPGTLAEQQLLEVALRRFSGIGAALVAGIVATGLVNSYFLVGVEKLQGLWLTPYGQLLSLKLVLFIAMLGFAARNRMSLSPALGLALEAAAPSQQALAALRRSVLSETAAAAAVLVLVAWLGTLEPIAGP
jgi:putative copper resistance protein D